MDKEDYGMTREQVQLMLQQRQTRSHTTYRPLKDLIVVGSDGFKYRYISSHNAWDKIDES